MTKRITWMLLVVFGLGLVFSAPSAWANERTGSSTGQWRAQDAGRIDVKVRHAGQNGIAASVVLYDQEWKVVSESQAVGGKVAFERLKAGDYHIMAYTDDLEDSFAKDIPVFARRTTTLEMKLNKPVSASNSGWFGRASKSCGVVSGEGNQLKIGNPYNQRIVYYQCGHIIGKLGGSSCSSCGRAGTWRYTTTCEKSTPIIIYLPCPGRQK